MSLTNVIRREATRVMNQKAVTLMGKVTSYDPGTYSAKVALQPEGQETGFLPIASPWVGSGWGMFCPPSPGDTVDVHFQEAGKGAPYISLRFFGNVAQPLSVPSGDFWLVHQSGSFLKFRGDGTIEMNARVIDVTAPTFNLTGNLNVTGIVTATGDIIDRNNAAGSMQNIRAVYDLHQHRDSLSGTTSVPLAPEDL